MEDLAATDSPATWVAVPWALGDFTAEFGMGSGVGPPLEPPGRPAHPVVACWIGVSVVLVVCVGVVCAGRVGGAARPVPVWGGVADCCAWWVDDRACRAIRTGQLRALPHFHIRPIDVLVLHGPQGDLVLRRVSRLDAFSGYPVRT